MRKSKAEAAATRRRIVETAAGEFVRHGIHATGIADLMAAAGLSPGGFYRHFASKDQLVAEACAFAMESMITVSAQAASLEDPKRGLEAFVGSYLAIDHCDDEAGGCPLAALGSEIMRCDDATRAAVTQGVLKFVDAAAQQRSNTRGGGTRAKALAALATMVGAVTISRIVNDPELSEEILQSARDQLEDL